MLIVSSIIAMADSGIPFATMAALLARSAASCSVLAGLWLLLGAVEGRAGTVGRLGTLGGVELVSGAVFLGIMTGRRVGLGGGRAGAATGTGERVGALSRCTVVLLVLLGAAKEDPR